MRSQAHDVARVLLLDLATVTIFRDLRARGVRAILLKGQSSQRLLYGDSFRPYIDIDILVPPDDQDDAMACLRELGFRDYFSPPRDHKHDRPFVRDDGAIVDLHRTLSGIGVPPERCWEVLSAHTEVVDAANGLACLDAGALVAIVALHAAQHGEAEEKPITDLTRAVERLPLPIWEEAVIVARDLGAQEPFVAGLKIVPGGSRRIEELGLSNLVSAAVRLRAASAPVSAQELGRLVSTPGRRARWGVLRKVLLPTTEELRYRAWARRVVDWPAGKVLARVTWWLRITCELPGAVRWYRRRGRQAAEATSPSTGSDSSAPSK